MRPSRSKRLSRNPRRRRTRDRRSSMWLNVRLQSNGRGCNGRRMHLRLRSLSKSRYNYPRHSHIFRSGAGRPNRRVSQRKRLRSKNRLTWPRRKRLRPSRRRRRRPRQARRRRKNRLPTRHVRDRVRGTRHCLLRHDCIRTRTPRRRLLADDPRLFNTSRSRLRSRIRRRRLRNLCDLMQVQTKQRVASCLPLYLTARPKNY